MKGARLLNRHHLSQVEFNREMAEGSTGKMNGALDPDFAVFTEALRPPPEERDRYLDGLARQTSSSAAEWRPYCLPF